MAITLRATKGSELTHNELDTNFIDLRDGVAAQVPKTQNSGILIGPNGSETFGWQDLHSPFRVGTGPTAPGLATYIGGISAYQFTESDEAFITFHLPHDYAMGTDLYIHAHWSHSATTVTGGSVTWGFECTYSKGHDQAAFSSPIFTPVTQNANTTQYQHMVAETVMTSSGGSASTFDNGIIEVDGLVLVRVYLDSNDMTVSGGGVPEPFLHFVDIHYQSSGVGTKQKSPNFWA